MAVLGRREGMVGGGVTLGTFVVLEHREVDHPHRAPALFKQAVLLAEFTEADFDAQGTHRIIDNFRFVGTEENQVAVLRTGSLQHGIQGQIVNVLDNRALHAVATSRQFIDLDISQALGSVNFDELGVGINIAAAQPASFLGAPRNAQRHDATALHVGGPREHLEIDVFHHVSHFREFKLYPQIWLVGAVQVHGLLVSHDRKLTQIDLNRVLEDRGDHALEHGANLFFLQE